MTTVDRLVEDYLDRLGEPAEVADEARERFGVARPQRPSWHEIVTLILLLPGSFIPFGWLAGVVMLLFVLYGEAITAWMLVLVFLPVLTVLYLGLRLRQA